jgi:hypothetical protein
MSFRSAYWKSLFLGVLMPGAGAWAQSPPASPGQQIIFSTPEGQVVSNTAVPLAVAPEAEEPMDLPVEAPVSAFDSPMSPPVFPLPTPYLPQSDLQNSREINPMDPMNERGTLSLATPAQIMGAPTMQKIFGLPPGIGANGQKNPALGISENGGSTNIMSSGEASDEPTWAKFLAGSGGENTSDSSKTKKSHGLFDGFFSSSSGDGIFGSQDKNPAGGDFGSSSANGTSSGSSFDSSLAVVTPTSLGQATPTPNPAINAGFNQPSPFALPQSTAPQTLPQLPTLPSVPGQTFNPTPAPVPSWEPKPAPWLSPVPPPGTMQPRKF